MADDNRWSDRDRDWRDDRSFTEPGTGRDGRRRGRDLAGYNPAGPAQDGGYGAGRQGAYDERDYRAALAYQEGDPGFLDQGGRGYRGAQGSGGYTEARSDGGGDYRHGQTYGPGYGADRGDYGYGPYTPYGAVTEGETSSDGRRPAAWRGDDVYRGPSRGPLREGEHRSWMERTGEKLGHFVRELTPSDLRMGEHQGRGPKGYRRSDARISEDVSDRLTEDAYLDASDIEVAVDNGEVTLNGRVTSRAAKRRAEDIADSVSGVSHVQNNLRADEPRRDAPSEDEAIIDGTGLIPPV